MMTPDRRLTKVTLDLTRSPLFADMAGILMMGRKTVSAHIPTACTDGRDEQYGEAFIDRLDNKELAFVVLHESYSLSRLAAIALVLIGIAWLRRT